MLQKYDITQGEVKQRSVEKWEENWESRLVNNQWWLMAYILK